MSKLQLCDVRSSSDRDYDELQGNVSPQNEIVVEDNLDTRQQQQLPKQQSDYQAGKNHADRPETKALPNGCDQKHRGQENCNSHVLVSGFSGLCALIGYL